MKVQEHNDKRENQIVTGMVIDPVVLGKIASVWKKGMFRSPWGNIAGELLVGYWNKYKKPPGWKDTEGLILAWAEKNDEDTSEGLDTFLGNIYREWQSSKDGVNSEYLIDIAGRYLTEIKFDRALESAKGHKDSGDLEKAMETLSSLSKVEVGKETMTDPFKEEQDMMSIYNTKSDSLVNYDGDLGKFWGHALERDSFISFVAPEKRGKTWDLIDVAFTALLQRRRVAMFEIGDMSKTQILRRLYCRAAEIPLRSPEDEWPYAVKIPTSISPEGDVEFREETFKAPLSLKQIMRACNDLMLNRVKTKRSLFKLAVRSCKSLSVAGIRSLLQEQEKDGWVPDCVIIDYADLIAPPPGRMDVRDQINATWELLRQLSTDLHCCVVTATQANRAGYKADVLEMEHLSEDKRKLSHTTGVVGINATIEEKRSGITRLNWVTRREEDFDSWRCVHCAGCLPLGNPAVVSCYPREKYRRKRLANDE